MMKWGPGMAVAAIFRNEGSAREAVSELERIGHDDPWLAIVESAGEATTTQPSPRDRHVVADSSDGALGSIGRFISGDGSLRRSLVDHGVIEAIAREIDLAVERGNAVVVVSAENVGAATAALEAAGGDVYGVADVARASVARDRVSVAGQGDELDRGTGRAHSGGGLGST